nr:hypothetical protein Iba_chr06aCG2480 [Ipomoea batatas]GMD10076.1 hypothetical protein Iba_chr06eCG2770 [Ipomoea batatas]GME16171.1 hypothetical protein Iba_scaffold17159.3CG0200 [Ipomoea batatas]
MSKEKSARGVPELSQMGWRVQWERVREEGEDLRRGAILSTWGCVNVRFDASSVHHPSA